MDANADLAARTGEGTEGDGMSLHPLAPLVGPVAGCLRLGSQDRRPGCAVLDLAGRVERRARMRAA